MATFEKLILSGSTNGRAVKIVATATAGTLLHTAHATDLDEVWVWAFNSDTTARKLTLEVGGVLVDDTLEQTIPPESGLVLVIPGLILTGSVVLRAFCATANVVMCVGYVNRISP